MNKINIGVEINLDRLIESRLLIQASSGYGKSWCIRKIAECVGKKVQQIILDREGEFVSLREKFDFALASKEGGDLPISVRYAEVLAHKLLETNLSCIIDLSEMKHDERIQFVKRFCNALIDSPKKFWHPCLVYIDEAHLFAPEGAKSESCEAVINLCTQGRKRGICAILATQRVSKLNKDASAELMNKLIGGTGQDIDRKRAGDELGFNKHEDVLSLRNLNPGQFYAFGTAINNKPTLFKVDRVITSHTKSGNRILKVPPTSNAVKNILHNIGNIPEEAEKEIKTKEQLQSEVHRLKIELRKATSAKQHDHQSLDNIKQLESELKKQKDIIRSIRQNIHSIDGYAHKIISGMASIIDFEPPEILKSPHKPSSINDIVKTHSRSDTGSNTSSNYSATGGALRMLKSAAMFYPNPISRSRMGILSKMSHTSGSFNTYVSSLKKNGFIEQSGNDFIITEDGLKAAGDISAMPTDPEQILNLWCDTVGASSGAARILRVLFSNHPNEVSRNHVGEEAGISSTSGSFNTYISTLKRNGLIISNRTGFKISEEFFNNHQ